MKKQILFLAIFTLAIFIAGTTKSYAQDLQYIPANASQCVPAVSLSCVADDALNPLPGKEYTYTISVAPGVSTGNIQWIVTDNATVISSASGSGVLTTDIEPDPLLAGPSSSLFLLDAEDARYNQTTGNTNLSIKIKWQSFSAANVLLVAYVKGENGCTDNIEAYNIKPKFAFTLDIAGLNPDGTRPASGNASECVSPVQSALWNGTNLSMDYGENYIYYSVNAANFVHSWQPTFTVVGSSSPVALTDITWAYPADATGTTAWNAYTAPVLAKDPSGAVGPNGECIVVRVRVDHNNIENDVASNVNLGINGIMRDITAGNYTNVNLSDLDNAAAAPCVVGDNDHAIFDLTPRPNITDATPPASNDFVPKN